MSTAISNLNELLPEKVVELAVEYLAIILAALALLVVLVIIFIICLAVSGAKHKNAIRELEEKHKQDLEAASASKPQADGDAPTTDAELTERYNNLSAAVDSLNHEVVEKQQKIDELTAELEQAKNGVVSGETGGDGSAEVARLENEIAELKQKCAAAEEENKQLENEIKLRKDSAAGNSDRLLNENLELTRENIKLKSENEKLAAENESLKGASSSSASKKSKPAPKAEPNVKLVPKAAAAKPTAKPAEDDDVEVDDEFGDASSAIKVKVKYDHNKGNWVITRSDSDRTYRRVATKQEALSLGKDLARRLQAQLVVHKKDGKFQKV